MEFLRENFGLNVLKDDPEIHPPRFCHLCYLTPTRVDGPVFWHIHTDVNCVTCSFTEKKSKGGRPKKRKPGKKAAKQLEEEAETRELPRHMVTNVINKIEEIGRNSSTTISDRLMTPEFEFSGAVKEDFFCPICKDVLFQAVETVCEHCFCGECLKQGMLSSGIPFDCPVCKTELNTAEHIKKPSRMVLRLIAELKVKCNNCGSEFSYEDQSSHSCEARAGPAIVEPPAPIPAHAADPPAPNPTTLESAMADLQKGLITPQMEKMGTLFIKSKMKSLADGKTALLKTGGKVTQ